MRRLLWGMIVALAMIGTAMIAPAAQNNKPVLTQVTVSVQGLHCQGCIDELQHDLAKVPGVSGVKVTLQPPQTTARLDESIISASQFVAAITNHRQMMDRSKTYGARLVVFVDAEMCAKQAKMCPACFTEIPKVLKTIAGIDTVSLDATGKVVSVTFTRDANVPTQKLTKALAASDFKFMVSYMAPRATS